MTRSIRNLWLWSLSFLFWHWTHLALAQDEIPVPPLESGLLLTLHPIFVHFAIALIVFGTGCDWAGSVWRYGHWQQAGRLCFFAGVIALGLAVLSGWIEQELPRPLSAFDAQIQNTLFYHEYGGYGLLGFFLALAVARLRIVDRLPALFMIFSSLGLIGLFIQGYLGGELVYRYGAGVRAVQILSHQDPEYGQKKAPEESSGAIKSGE